MLSQMTIPVKLSGCFAAHKSCTHCARQTKPTKSDVDTSDDTLPAGRNKTFITVCAGVIPTMEPGVQKPGQAQPPEPSPKLKEKVPIQKVVTDPDVIEGNQAKKEHPVQ